MSQITRKWITDHAVDSTKIDPLDNYTMNSLTLTGTGIAPTLMVTGDATVTGDLAVVGKTTVTSQEVTISEEVHVNQSAANPGVYINQMGAADALQIHNIGGNNAISADIGDASFGSGSTIYAGNIALPVTGTAYMGEIMTLAGGLYLNPATDLNLNPGSSTTYITGDASVSNNLSVGGVIAGTTVSLDASVLDNLWVGNDASIIGNMQIEGGPVVFYMPGANGLTFAGSNGFQDNINAGVGDTIVLTSGTSTAHMYVGGYNNDTDDPSIILDAPHVDIVNNLNVGSGMTPADTSISHNLWVGNDASIIGNVTMGTYLYTGNSGSLNIEPSTHLNLAPSTDLYLNPGSGVTTCESNLLVNGDTTFSGSYVQVNNDLFVTNAIGIGLGSHSQQGALDVYGTAYFKEDTTFSGNAAFSGSYVQVDNNLFVTNAIGIGLGSHSQQGALDVYGTAYFKEDATFSGSHVLVDNDLFVTTAVGIGLGTHSQQGVLDVYGDVYFGGKVGISTSTSISGVTLNFQDGLLYSIT